jgi:hypothetical protein
LLIKLGCAALLLPMLASAGAPAEYGLSEYRRALAERGLNAERFKILTEYSIVLDADGFSITGNIIRGGSERGLMYGLLEAADQIRSKGRLVNAKGTPATPMRGVRRFLHNADLERDWYFDKDQWRAFFEMLAHNRFNRFNLVFAHQTAYMAPPYPYWVNVDAFPQVRARGLSPQQQEKNFAMLRFISEAAADHGVDFTLGIWEQDVQPGMESSVEGLTAATIGPYTYEALKLVLKECPAIRSVQIRTNPESGIPRDREVEFFKEYVFRALYDTGRLTQLDLRGWQMEPGLMQAALDSKVPVRISSKYWAEDLGRPYQPAETWAGYSFLNFLEKPPEADRQRAWQFYWELWGLGSHRLLMWGDPEYVRRIVPTLTMSESIGFEIDPPLAQMGFGNQPGQWSVFTEQQSQRVFWKYQWQRYWLFYLLWGRLSYNPEEPGSLWLDEFKRRFGGAAGDAAAAVQASSKVLNEIVAVHLADPNMYVWPEINPGGLIDSYKEVRPSDWSFITSFEESVQSRLAGGASAKQNAQATAARLNEFALKTEQALARASNLLGDKHAEWSGTKPDLQVLAMLARYHARKQMAADNLAWFDATWDPAALPAARSELEAALRIWQQLAALTDGLYPAEMTYGPEDRGSWKDKLAYVEEDLKLVDQRIAVFEKLGRFDLGIDFGGAVESPVPGSYRDTAYVLRNTVAPGFAPADAATEFSESRGFGWAGAGKRETIALPLTPYAEVRAVARQPRHLPGDVLCGDYVRGEGRQTFRVKMPDGSYTVKVMRQGGEVETSTVAAAGGFLDILTPENEWSMCAVTILSNRPAPSIPFRWPKQLPRPSLEESPPKTAIAGKPLRLSIRVPSNAGAKLVRLHYRPLSQLAAWKNMDAAPQHAEFTIPPGEVSAKWDLQYYFEILNGEGGGWFQPDPLIATPYHVVRVEVDTSEQDLAPVEP